MPGHTVQNTQLFVSTGEQKWKTDFSGGVVASSLTDRKYRATLSDSSVEIARAKKLEDSQRLTLAAFTHVYHSRWVGSIFDFGTPAISAGLSLNNGDNLDYFLGPSFLFGNAAINMGIHWGQTASLPRNISLNSHFMGTVDEANALLDSTTETRTDRGFFISVTFTFAGPGQAPFSQIVAIPDPQSNNTTTE